jgi:hypothetical protein
MDLEVKPKKKQRFYLLPGMGGSALRRKRKLIWRWTIGVGVVVSGILGVLLYLMSR